MYIGIVTLRSERLGNEMAITRSTLSLQDTGAASGTLNAPAVAGVVDRAIVGVGENFVMVRAGAADVAHSVEAACSDVLAFGQREDREKGILMLGSNVVFEKEGEKHTVSFAGKGERFVERIAGQAGALLVHNHNGPTCYPISLQDLLFSYFHNIDVLAASPDGGRYRAAPLWRGEAPAEVYERCRSAWAHCDFALRWHCASYGVRLSEIEEYSIKQHVVALALVRTGYFSYRCAIGDMLKAALAKARLPVNCTGLLAGI